ncbi:S8 family peptidase [Antribacter gilvus]|uniref:S8 family peptidase n=1 Tax=Antribacter gilvus TaxID=2304675 RepID=UPI0013E0DFC9|nr:S8 family peptidase [Antribacter gilvus]
MRTRAGAAAAVATAIVLGGGTWSAVAAPGGGLEPAAVAGAPGATTAARAAVTLITGDRVMMTTQPDGRRSASVFPAPGREGIAFRQLDDGDHLYVIPADVADLVPDRLDLALFDVAGLVAAGYDDASRDTLPVIVQAEATMGIAARGATGKPDWAAAGLSPDRELESVGAIADDLPRGRAAKLLDALRTADAGAPAQRSAAATGGLRVWLDAPVRSTDADSIPQIGAPEAWAAGYTGAGVTVAVLDTGIDATHPDLDEVVVGEADFTESGGVTDGHGHGTHVSSIVAGSGEASDGTNRGVAPDADLLVGKVLDDGGSGELSGVIEGMEWAAAAGADIVSMSLGASQYTDGTDPGALAVDALSAQYGTLFVIAAGNDYGYGTIASPGSASSALTVGAVNDDDQVTEFSSRGPRAGDYAIKPDVTAPGEGIVAARAAGTTMGEAVGDHYVAASGTSMATPHVAGAAAVLKQARPELTGSQLKTVLMASAQPTGGTVWEEGAGRIHLPSAIATQLTTAPETLSLGAFEYPHAGSSSGTVTYTNPTDDEVTLDLTVAVSGPEGEPAEGATLSAETVTIPAGGTASVDVTVDQGPGSVGRYSGAVLATAADGTTVRTALGWYKEPQLFDLTVRGIGQDGATWDGSAFVAVASVEDMNAFMQFGELADGELTYRVPAGTYSVSGDLYRMTEEYVITELTSAMKPEVVITGDTVVSIDVREAEPVSVSTHKRADLEFVAFGTDRIDVVGNSLSSMIVVEGTADISLTPTEPVTVGEFTHTTQAYLEEPTTGDEAPDYSYTLVHRQDGAVEDTAFVSDRSNTAEVRTSYHELGPDMAAQIARMGFGPNGSGMGIGVLVDTPSVRTEYLSSGDIEWGADTFLTENWYDGVGGFMTTSFDVYEAGKKYEESWFSSVVSGGYSGGVAYQVGDRLIASLPFWKDAEGRPYVSFIDEIDAELRFRLWQDGELVAENADAFADVQVPADGARYRMALDAARETPYWALSTDVSTAWEFDTAPLGEEEGATLPLLDVTYDVKGLDVTNSAPRSTTVTLSVAHVVETSGTVERVRAWWSSDDGATWHRAPVSATGDGVYAAKVKAPRGTDHVSLKVEAWDEAGSTIEQTIVRAYAVD